MMNEKTMNERSKDILNYVGDDGEFLYPIDEAGNFDYTASVKLSNRDENPIFSFDENEYESTFWMLFFIISICGLPILAYAAIMFATSPH